MHNKLKELVQDSDLGQVQKNVAIGILTRAEVEAASRRRFRDIVETIIKPTYYSFSNIIETEEFIIYKIADSKDEWVIKYPYRFCYIQEGIWCRSSAVCQTLDEALLSYLQYKYLNEGSQFAMFAMKMLGMDLTEK